MTIETHSLNALLKFDNQRKYWLQLRSGDFEDREMPPILINRVQKKGFIQCQTLDLVKLNRRVSDSANEVVMLSDAVIEKLLDTLRSQIPHLFRVCESIALLDMLASFSHHVITNDYVRPKITRTLALDSARHPMIENVSSINSCNPTVTAF
jgi:DNA mismatch repair protein MSH4